MDGEADTFISEVVESSDVTCFILEDCTEEEALQLAELIMKGIDAAVEVVLTAEAIKEYAEEVY